MSELLNRYTQYEIGLVLLSGLIFFAIAGLVTFLLTKDKRAVWTVLGSLMASVLLISITLTISRFIFDVTLSDRYILQAATSLIIISINISILVGEYTIQLGRKDFDIDHVTRAHFSTTLNSTIIISLAILSFIVFIPTELKIMSIIFLIPTLLSIWATHFFSRKLLVDEQ